MNKRTFLVLILSTIALGALLNITATHGNNFYFTSDQGKDAVFVREILERKRLILHGPVTSVPGVHAGFLWFYYILIGYAIFSGNPFGAVFMSLLLSLFTTAVLMYWVGKKINRNVAILVGVVIQVFWRYFENSLWGFNPFPLASLSILAVLFLTEFLAGNERYYIYGLFPILLAFHTEIAGASSLLFFYSAVGVYGLIKKKLSRKTFLFAIIIPVIIEVNLIFELTKVFLKSILSQHTGLGILSGTDFTQMFRRYLEIIGFTISPQLKTIGSIAYLLIVVIYFFSRKLRRNLFSYHFISLTLLLLILSFLFFGSNRGWRDWQTFYLYPLLFISYIFMLVSFSQKKVAYFLLIITMTMHVVLFATRFAKYKQPSDDPSILANQLTALDWIYTHNDNVGFNAYNYTDAYYDYTYQYLFWWYGKGKYGFVPCEYANYPKSNKETYIPSYLEFSEPRLGCDRLRFLIIESPTNGQSNKDWIISFQQETRLLDSTKVGKILVEKREVVN